VSTRPRSSTPSFEADLKNEHRTLNNRGHLRGLVVLDEIQRRPELFPALRVLPDRRPLPARFLVLGSASLDLLRQASESLAGRIAFHELPGIALGEVGARNLNRLWLRGAFPRSLSARSDAASAEWRREFVRTFLERDLPQLGSTVPAQTLGRFWAMLAHVHGNVWNGSEFGRAFGVAHTTVRRYLDLLSGAFVVRQLPPWSASLAKRQVKSQQLRDLRLEDGKAGRVPRMRAPSSACVPRRHRYK
jgi:predicted AAA+ superfamily ATPase